MSDTNNSNSNTLNNSNISNSNNSNTSNSNNSNTNNTNTSNNTDETTCETYEHSGFNTSDSVQVGELESLINILQQKIDNGHPHIKSIKHPTLLISSLIELNCLVGMQRLKDSIALQIMRLIDGARQGEKGSKMLNTILYGPPGVGKTKVGIILAKIWYALGYLKKPLIKQKSFFKGETTTSVVSNNESMNALIPIVLLILFYSFTYIIAGMSYVYSNWGMMWLGSIFFIFGIIILLLYWNREKCSNYITITTSEEKPTHQTEDRDLIKVVSRQHFVAEYMGQTAPKTNALLQANLGKVLLIDEAYALYHGERDQFGVEALTALNLFMSEHPNEIAVIFCGYKELMKNGVFKIQPGLPRRCMWHFSCDGYNGEQLADIFYRQVYQDGWAIKKDDYLSIRRLIKENSDMFGSYGGDTERLLFYSQLEVSRSNVMQSSYLSDFSSSDNSSGSSKSSKSEKSNNENNSNNKKYNGKVLTYQHVQHGLRRLSENNIDEDF